MTLAISPPNVFSQPIVDSFAKEAKLPESATVPFERYVRPYLTVTTALVISGVLASVILGGLLVYRLRRSDSGNSNSSPAGTPPPGPSGGPTPFSDVLKDAYASGGDQKLDDALRQGMDEESVETFVTTIKTHAASARVLQRLIEVTRGMEPQKQQTTGRLYTAGLVKELTHSDDTTTFTDSALYSLMSQEERLALIPCLVSTKDTSCLGYTIDHWQGPDHSELLQLGLGTTIVDPFLLLGSERYGDDYHFIDGESAERQAFCQALWHQVESEGTLELDHEFTGRAHFAFQGWSLDLREAIAGGDNARIDTLLGKAMTHKFSPSQILNGIPAARGDLLQTLIGKAKAHFGADQIKSKNWIYELVKVAEHRPKDQVGVLCILESVQSLDDRKDLADSYSLYFNEQSNSDTAAAIFVHYLEQLAQGKTELTNFGAYVKKALDNGMSPDSLDEALATQFSQEMVESGPKYAGQEKFPWGVALRYNLIASLDQLPKTKAQLEAREEAWVWISGLSFSRKLQLGGLSPTASCQLLSMLPWVQQKAIDEGHNNATEHGCFVRLIKLVTDQGQFKSQEEVDLLISTLATQAEHLTDTKHIDWKKFWTTAKSVKQADLEKGLNRTLKTTDAGVKLPVPQLNTIISKMQLNASEVANGVRGLKVSS